jgi:hypothetical protein
MVAIGRMSGAIYDLIGSCRAAFLTGIAWKSAQRRPPSGFSSAACARGQRPRDRLRRQSRFG